MNPTISPSELKELLDTGASVRVLDVRLIEDRTPVDHPVPGAEWRNPKEVENWGEELGAEDHVVVYCDLGHHVSQGGCTALRENGLRVSYLDGGIEGWEALIRSGSAKADT